MATLGEDKDKEVNWFHGSLPREIAEITLRKDGKDEPFHVGNSEK